MNDCDSRWPNMFAKCSFYECLSIYDFQLFLIDDNLNNTRDFKIYKKLI